MSIAEKLTTIANNVQKTVDLNENLENILAGTDTGGKSWYDEFWDAVQLNGERVVYNFAFSGNMWTQETFKPKYPIRPVHANNCFAYWGYEQYVLGSIDLRTIEIDFSNTTSCQNAFSSNSSICAVGIMNVKKANNLTNLFSDCIRLETVERLILADDGSQIVNGIFENNTALTNIIVEGTIGQNGFNVRWSTKLTKASITSIINALSTTTNNLTVTLSKTSVDNAFATNDVYIFSTGVNSESTGTISTNITYPLTISAVNNSVELTRSIWRVRATYADGTFMYYFDSETTSPKTFEASEENPIVKIEYRNTHITNGSYDFRINYTPGTESQEWLELISTKSNWTINLV